jgi:hypothetical protein
MPFLKFEGIPEEKTEGNPESEDNLITFIHRTLSRHAVRRAHAAMTQSIKRTRQV